MGIINNTVWKNREKWAKIKCVFISYFYFTLYNNKIHIKNKISEIEKNNKCSLNKLWAKAKKSNIHISSVQEWEKENRTENEIFKEIRAKIFYMPWYT